MPRAFERLPSTVVPKHYDLFIEIDLVKCVFKGQVTADLEVKQPTKRIVLNSQDLKVEEDIKLQLSNGSVIQAAELDTSDNDCETIALVFPSDVPVGNCKVTLKFSGELNDSLRGLYRSKYTSHDTNEERYCAVTQFEACDAHRAFPCWDDPAIKATFDISLSVPKDRVALSNMPIKSEQDLPDGKRLVKFETTPIMSTYLVAMVVGEFDFIEDTTSDGIKVRVYTPVKKQEQGQFALEVAVRVLPYYKDYFKMPYPLPKMDLIAIGSFSAGAMENWGLVTYRETCLLVDPLITSTQRKQWIALIVAHELAHQWFGNLVTMEWWTHLWLNEGYATFAEFLCVANLYPEYDMWTQFVTETWSPALKLDALKNSHPIEVPVGHPLEVDEIFDDISYSKGASVIRMLHKYIGDEDFAKGMNLYFNKYQYGNAATDDLWTTLEEASNKPISSVMSKWTRQMGYPVISVRSEQDGNNRKFYLKQSQYWADGSPGSGESQLWMVPIEFSSAKAPNEVVHEVLFDKSEAEVVIPGISESEWVKLNPGSVGFYRVQYSKEMLQMFKPAVSNLTLPPLDRLGLLGDLFALVQSGQTSTDQALLLVEAMQSEDNCTVWSSMTSVLMKIRMLLQYAEDIHPNFMAFGRRLLSRISSSVSWDPRPDEGHKDKLLRNVILDLLYAFEDEATVTEAHKRFEAHKNGTAPLWSDIRGTVYKTVLRNADAATYETFLKLYRQETLQEEKERILCALAAIKNETLQAEVLKFALTDEVRRQTTLTLLGAIAQSRKGRDLVWNYVTNNWDELHKKYGTPVILSGFISTSFSHYASEEKAVEVEKFFAEHNTSGAERAVQQTVERIRINAAWLQRDLPCIRAFLQNYK
ncbi:hypothetical protein ONE63_002076 [Megalurothrips usitatus]|uniref:Aminopeptidase n=1 Tax=Megalurothrips usitatus TaxID=439358 RepID=A0AAV7XGN7_9NEOP|nr:hypothetical protein ONE63_002076 [Megalurothrips usitatus]